MNKKFMIFLILITAIVMSQINWNTAPLQSPERTDYLMILNKNMDSTSRATVGRFIRDNGIIDSTVWADSIAAFLSRGLITFTGDIKVNGNDFTFGNGASVTNPSSGILALNSTVLSITGDSTAVNGVLHSDTTKTNVIILPNGAAITNDLATRAEIAEDTLRVIGQFIPQRKKLDDNIQIGANTGNATMTGISNILIGTSTGTALTTGIYNTIVGTQSGQYGAYTNSTHIGYFAGRYGRSYNTMVGVSSGRGVITSTTGTYNTFMGYQSGMNITSGSANTIFGAAAGTENTTGKYNIIVGYDAELETANTDSSISLGNYFYGNYRVRDSEVKANNTIMSGLRGSMYVAMIDTVVYIATKYNATNDLVYIFKGCGANDLFTFEKVVLKANSNNYINPDVTRTIATTIQTQTGTDVFPGGIGWGLGALPVGGNHTYGGYKTAKTISYEIYANGIKLRHKDKIYTDEVQIRTVNEGYSPVTLPIVKRVVTEYINFNIKNNTIEFSNTHTLDSTNVISTYYGVMSEGSQTWQDSVYFAHSDSCHWRETGRGSIIYSGAMSTYPNVEKMCFKSDDQTVTMQVWIDNSYGLPSLPNTYISNPASFSKVYLKDVSTDKGYFNLIRGYSATAGESYSYRGSYSFEDQSDITNDSVVLTKGLMYRDAKPVFYADVKATQSVVVPKELSGMECDSLKVNTGTISNVAPYILPAKYYEVTATGYGNIYLKKP